MKSGSDLSIGKINCKSLIFGARPSLARTGTTLSAAGPRRCQLRRGASVVWITIECFVRPAGFGARIGGLREPKLKLLAQFLLRLAVLSRVGHVVHRIRVF